jgi:SAM-dependent methyltransferase
MRLAMIRSPARRTRIVAVGFLAAAAAALAAVLRHGRAGDAGRTVPGGILIGNVVTYDYWTGFLLRSLFRGIAANVAAIAPIDARVLEVGCGPGHLSISMARQHGLDVTALDLDPAMIERARSNASRAAAVDARVPSFVVGDVATLPFPDGTFDLVVSTFSMHHWADPTAGLAEIGRVLGPGARALIWDFRPGSRPPLLGRRHGHIPDPAEHARGSQLHVVSSTPWRWPWRFSLAQRIELVRDDASPVACAGTRSRARSRGRSGR